MLTISELLQTARAVAPDAAVRNLTRSEQVELDPAEHKAKVPRTVADRARHGPAVVQDLLARIDPWARGHQVIHL